MARKQQRSEKRGHRWLLEATALLLAAVALLIGLSLGSYYPTDPSWGVVSSEGVVQNRIGPLGAHLAFSFYEILGLAAWILPPLLAGFAALVLVGHRVRAQLPRLAGMALAVLAVATLLHLSLPDGIAWREGTIRAGGLLGYGIASTLASYVHTLGAALVATTGLLVSILLITRLSLVDAIERLGKAAARLNVVIKALAAMVFLLLSSVWNALASVGGSTVSVLRASTLAIARLWNQQLTEWRKLRESRKQAKADRAKRRAAEQATKAATVAAAAAQKPRKSPAKAEPVKVTKKEKKKPAASASPKAAPTPAAVPASKPPSRRPDAGFVLPELELFDAPDQESDFDESVLLHNAQMIVAKYAEFGIEGKVLQIHPGPVVTTYEFKPEAGVKYSKITGLAEDLCLALRAEAIRIDRIPGKSTVGIELPNAERQTIRMSEIVNSVEYTDARSQLTLALGKTIEGDPYTADLAKMPHLLIAGSTGSGKSVSVNSMICSILFRSTPEQVRFILIDPKRLELGLYRDLPHLYTPVVTDPKLAVNALQWAVHEMEERYKKLAEVAVRNIDQYNVFVEKNKKSAAPEEGHEQKLPYVVIVVDELADLMMVTRGGVEESLARLAQMARAVGIHLILATQRPSVDVLTGVIKANFPSRVSFRVSSRVDSRTVLDANGAEQLLGKGDLLLLPPGSARIIRLHAPYLTEGEIERLAEHWKAQAEPNYREDVVAPPKQPDKEREEIEDDLYEEAARIIVDRQEASVSYLQRRLRIGYARAARLVDLMEQDGIVGPSPDSGGKMREVLVPANYFAEIDAAQTA